MLRTPESINSNVNLLLKKIPHSERPVYVAVQPSPEAKVDECFLNVDRKISKDSGSIVLGWAVWQNEFLIEAEFHSIWKSNEGKLIDITPKKNREPKILFIPDSSAKYQGIQADNVRINTSGNALVDDFIELFEARFRLLNKGERKSQLGEVVLSGKEASLYQGIEMNIQGVQWMLSNHDTRNSPCFCRSGLKYKNCHGRDLMSTLKRI
jgi:hypothetical protein